MRWLMVYQRGDVIAVPYDYSDLTGGKVRPAVIVSSERYNAVQPDVVAAGISSNIIRVGSYDHVLVDWRRANLRYASVVRGRLLTIEQRIIRRFVGRLSVDDLDAVEAQLVRFVLSEPGLVSYVNNYVDLTTLPTQLVQILAERSIEAAVSLTAHGNPMINIRRLRILLGAE